MDFDHWLAGIVAAGLLLYLAFVLLGPENF
ncbi:potassium transporter TrkH [Methyloceanibacter methanicus]|uniref:Potassium transporter TrkH n=1 Tax=Methyloceanibacter methanicus TaxID=1774968 RepID=A0A1E3VWG4_9HYPH|nr:potassium-transporting ATPase subunit F [Methyloceanibacter methanicus]ODR97865.1 potassium transporter TrkH [Methyloceanibacter methanicus]